MLLRPGTRLGRGLILILVAIPVLALAGCLKTEATVPVTYDASVMLPQVALLPETPAVQTKRGVSITLAPVTFEAVPQTQCRYELATGFLLVTPRGVSRTTHRYLAERRWDGLRVAPSDLEFLLTVTNQMDRVFRGAGAVVQFQIDGQAQAVDQSRYAQFLNALITPRGQSQLRIGGPLLPQVRPGARLGIFLSDVVTAVDNAGSITGRDNFEWYFTFSAAPVRRTVPLIRRAIWVPNAEARPVVRTLPDGRDQVFQIPANGCLPDTAIVVGEPIVGVRSRP